VTAPSAAGHSQTEEKVATELDADVDAVNGVVSGRGLMPYVSQFYDTVTEPVGR